MPESSSTPAVPEGRIQKLSDGYAVAFDRQFDYPAAHIWDVLTNPRKISQWLGRVTPEWQLGKEYTLALAGGTASGTVLQFNPRSNLQITWEDPLGLDSVLEWQVLESAGGALLRFRSRTDSPDFLAEGSAGWQEIMDSFANVAAGRSNTAGETGNWLALRDAYAHDFDVSPCIGILDRSGPVPEIVFERWFQAPAEDVEEAVSGAGGVLNIAEHALMELTDRDGETRVLIRQPAAGSPEDTAGLLAAWHMALDSARDRLDGRIPHPNAHRLVALEEFYRTMA